MVSISSPSRHRRHRRTDREGVATVEAAICIPIIIILMLGTLEVCSGIFLRESLEISAYEAVRVGVRRRATAEDVRQRAIEVLAARQITLPMDQHGEPMGISIVPPDFSVLGELDPITVIISAPTSGNSMYVFDTLYNRNIQSSVSMVREFND